MTRARRGVALLEAIVALAILSIAGSALLAMTSTAIRVSTEIARSDATMQQAGALLDAVVLWSREDLDRRLGERPQGPFRMQITRPTSALYRVTLVDTLTNDVLLTTAVFRAEVPDVSR